MADDPLTQVYNHIWTLLEANASWAAAVRPTNRIKLTAAQTSPWLQQALADADFPRAVLLPGGGNGQYGESSSRHGLSQNYALHVATAAPEVSGTDACVHRLKLLTLAALWKGLYGRTFIPDVTDVDFCMPAIHIGSIAEEPGAAPWADQVGGWLLTFTITAEFSFVRSSFEAYI